MQMSLGNYPVSEKDVSFSDLHKVAVKWLGALFRNFIKSFSVQHSWWRLRVPYRINYLKGSEFICHSEDVNICLNKQLA
jgi:hypothetical protein